MSRGRPLGRTGSASVLSDKDLKVVLYDISKNGHNALRNTALVLTSFKLGLRSKELASLKVQDVYEKGEIKPTLRLIGEYTKGNKHRDLPLENEELRHALLNYINERKSQEKLFFDVRLALFKSQYDGHFSPNSMARVLKNIYTKSGFENASSHSGRRSLLTKLANAGVSAFHIRDIAGHSSIMTTQRYIDSNPTVLADILKDV